MKLKKFITVNVVRKNVSPRRSHAGPSSKSQRGQAAIWSSGRPTHVMVCPGRRRPTHDPRPSMQYAVPALRRGRTTSGGGCSIRTRGGGGGHPFRVHAHRTATVTAARAERGKKTRLLEPETTGVLRGGNVVVFMRA